MNLDRDTLLTSGRYLALGFQIAGSIVARCFEPPVRSFAPALSASPIQRSTRSASLVVIKELTSVAGSIG